MQHIISNPHNGAPVDHEGIMLNPGYELHVLQQIGEDLIKRFEFLLLRLVPGNDKAVAKAKPVPIKGTLEWKLDNAGTDELPAPDQVQHVVVPPVAKKPAKPAAAKKVVAKKK